MSRPRIAVTTSRGWGRWLWWWCWLAITRAGGRAVRLKPGRAFELERLDGLLVGGGDDISPTLYRGELDPAVKIDPERDRLELEALEHARARSLPVLGICRGAQMINVFLGGSLHEDIYEIYEAAPKLRTVLPKKRVHVSEGSQLDSILECRACRVNALHHQSVDRVGKGLEVVARDEHGMVQAVERLNGPFMIGVQWHPEFLVFDRGQQRLFRRLVDAARHQRAT
ncbi:MAG: gamma-glutamyl-gamma-aminobutyrate hydrolase family protein, partial [Geminicoccaceae bacterium]|nr:gamma-glutamyl-gamma-aminobutyrate hydrolase family protein [Geminicoccaceae bacterium]